MSMIEKEKTGERERKEKKIFQSKSHFYFCTNEKHPFVFLCSLQATMLKKNKVKRRNTEPSIQPAANGEGGGKSTND